MPIHVPLMSTRDAAPCCRCFYEPLLAAMSIWSVVALASQVYPAIVSDCILFVIRTTEMKIGTLN